MCQRWLEQSAVVPRERGERRLSSLTWSLSLASQDFSSLLFLTLDWLVCWHRPPPGSRTWDLANTSRLASAHSCPPPSSPPPPALPRHWSCSWRTGTSAAAHWSCRGRGRCLSYWRLLMPIRSWWPESWPASSGRAESRPSDWDWLTASTRQRPSYTGTTGTRWRWTEWKASTRICLTCLDPGASYLNNPSLSWWNMTRTGSKSNSNLEIYFIMNSEVC